MNLYRISNGQLETVTLIREQIAPGATLPTYLIKYADGRVAQCSKSMFYETVKAAWDEHRWSLKSAIADERNHIIALEKQIVEWEKDMAKIPT